MKQRIWVGCFFELGNTNNKIVYTNYAKAIWTRPSALSMSDPGVEPLEILEILELETPPYPRLEKVLKSLKKFSVEKFEKVWKSL